MRKHLLFLLFVLLLCLSVSGTAFATNQENTENEKMEDSLIYDDLIMVYRRVEDGADLLTDEEEQTLIEKLDSISVNQLLDVVVVTTNTTNGKSPMEYADDFFDYNGYGMGEERDGVLLMIDMGQRDYWISTSGYGIEAFTDAGISYIGEQIVGPLGNGDYVEAFELFADLCDDFVTQAKKGNPYDVSHMPKAPFNKGLCFWISLFIGFVLSAIVNMILQAQLKTVARQNSAANYAKAGSLVVTHSYEGMRDRRVIHELIKSDSDDSRSGGGGSSTHISSSGRSHGGGGGKF
jgi:uncharacterized protein